MRWKDCIHVFYIDGSYRDVYVLDTTASDWERFLALVRERYPASTFDGVDGPAPIPRSFDEAGDDEGRGTLHVMVGKVMVNCFFIWDKEIELDIDPSEVVDEADLDGVVGFCEALGRTVGKDVHITDEGCDSPADEAWLIYRPSSDEWTVQKLDKLSEWGTKQGVRHVDPYHAIPSR